MTTEIQKQRILIVDDDLSNLDSYKNVFLREHYEVMTASHPQIAFDLYRQERFDLVLCDLQMPSMTGDQLMHLCLKVRPHVPFVFVTAFGTVNIAVDLLKSGAFHFLTKPVTKAKLVQAVEDALAEKKLADTTPETPLENSELIGQAPHFLELVEQARTASHTHASVLLLGENGTGKELFARFIHAHSARKNGPLVIVNCAAIPETLIEAELFGVMKGAFTGATQNKMGRIEAAHTGTLFLDEIADIPPATQVKLLRVIQEGTFERVGSSTTQKSDFRLICATNRNLEQALSDGTLREDLYYRIHVVSLTMPSLRDRASDIPVLTRHFAETVAKSLSKPVPRITPLALAKLEKHSWPGNIRELRNVIEQALVFCHDTIDEKHIQLSREDHWKQKSISIPVGTPLREIERRVILDTLRATQFDKELTARLLGTTVRTLYRRFDEWKIDTELPPLS